MLSCNPAHAARRSESGPGGSRLSRCCTVRRKARICERSAASRLVMSRWFPCSVPTYLLLEHVSASPGRARFKYWWFQFLARCAWLCPVLALQVPKSRPTGLRAARLHAEVRREVLAGERRAGGDQIGGGGPPEDAATPRARPPPRGGGPKGVGPGGAGGGGE